MNKYKSRATSKEQRNKYGMGWFNESHRHSLARQGIKTGRKLTGIGIGLPSIHYSSYTNVSIGDAFFSGKTEGSSLHMKIVDIGNKTLLVGYGHAVYGSRDKNTGEVTFYKGWDGYSRTTSKQLSQTGLRKAVNISDKKPSLGSFEDDIKEKPVNYSLESYKGRGVFDPFYEDMTDTDRDGIPDVYDLHPTDPTKGIEWSKSTEWTRIIFFPRGKGIKGQLLPRLVKKPNLYQRSFIEEKNGKLYRVYQLKRGKKGKIIKQNKTLLFPEKINYAEQVRWDWSKPSKKAKIEAKLTSFVIKNIAKPLALTGTLSKKEREKIKRNAQKLIKRLDYSKPEIKGQQLRIRMLSPKRFTKFRTQDVGKKGRLQRLAGYSPKTGWETQSWRLNLSNYKSFDDFKRDLLRIKISPQKREHSLTQALKYYRKR